MNGCRRRPCGVCGVRAVEAARQLLAPELDGLAARRQAAAAARRLLVDRIVDRAAEVPDRHDRAALVGGQHQERVVEAGLARHYGAAASAPRASRSTARSRAPSVGRSSRAARRGALDAIEDAAAAEPREAQLEDAAGRARRRRPRGPRRTVRVSGDALAERGHPRRSVDGPVAAPLARAAGVYTSRGTYSRPARQSRPKSCQKFVNCSAVHSASDDRSSALVAIAGDAQDQPADRIRRSAAVVEHLGPRSVSRRHGILTERAQQIVEQRDRQIERSDRVRERDDNQILVRIGGGARRVPYRRRRACSRRCQASSRARRSSAGAVPRRRCRRRPARTRRWQRRAAASPRQQARRHGKILVMRSRQRLACRVRARERSRIDRDGALRTDTMSRPSNRDRRTARAARHPSSSGSPPSSVPMRVRDLSPRSSRCAAPRRRQPGDDAAGVPAAAAARARLGAGAGADDHRGDSGGGRSRAVQRGRAAFYYGDHSIDKDLIVAVRVLINGAPIAATCRTGTPRRRRARRRSFDDRPEGIARDRWDVAIETETGTTLVECGAIRERVSQELARAVFDAVKRELEQRDNAER